MGVCGSTTTTNKKANNFAQKIENAAHNDINKAENAIKKEVKDEGNRAEREAKKEIEDAKKTVENDVNKASKEAEKKINQRADEVEKDINKEAQNIKKQAEDEEKKITTEAKDTVNQLKSEANKETTKLDDEFEAASNKMNNVAVEVKKKINDSTKKVSMSYEVLKKRTTTKVLNFVNTTFGEINHAAKQIKKYYQNQKPYRGEGLFTDSFFPPDKSSIFGFDENGEIRDRNQERRVEAEANFQIDNDDIVWLRPCEIFGPEFALFEGKIEFDDIRQGSIGNCYFMASISALTECPQIVAEIYRQHDVQKNGYYEICLKLDGEWNVVILDDLIPCSKSTKKPIFAKPKGNELWAILLEKAWAKVNGGYINTVAGMASEVIECLTNFPYEYHPTKLANTDEEEKENLWQRILVASGNDYIMTTALPQREGAKDVGLVEGHEYTLQYGKEYDYQGENIRLLKIRNPWGSINYRGDWSQNSSKWNSELKEVFDYKSVYDGEGEFYISYDDFLYFFADVDICKIEDRICMKQSKITYSSGFAPKVFEFHVHKQSKVDITMYKPYYRFVKDLPTDWSMNQHLLVAKCEDEDNLVFSKIWGNCEAMNDCTLFLELEEGTYFMIVYADYSTARDIEGQLLGEDTLQNAKTMVNICCSEFFEFHEKGEDPELSMLYRIIASYNRENVPDVENKVLIRAENNFMKSEFYYFYLKNIMSVPLLFTSDFSSSIELKQFDNSNCPSSQFIIAPDQEYLAVFSCNNQFAGHGIGYSYTYKKGKTDPQDTLFPHLIQLTECPADSLDVEKYGWIYKKTEVDYSHILKKIDSSDAAFKHLKVYYPHEIEEIEGVPKLENHDQLGLEVQDKQVFDEAGDEWYIGEWRTVNSEFCMWGRGMCKLSGQTFIGQFQNHAMNGIGVMILPDGSKVESKKFVNFQPTGQCFHTRNDGVTQVVNY